MHKYLDAYKLQFYSINYANIVLCNFTSFIMNYLSDPIGLACIEFTLLCFGSIAQCTRSAMSVNVWFGLDSNDNDQERKKQQQSTQTTPMIVVLFH